MKTARISPIYNKLYQLIIIRAFVAYTYLYPVRLKNTPYDM